MTLRERYRRVMAFQPVDRVPNFELCLWGQTTERWIREGMPETVSGNFFPGEPYFHLDVRDFVPLDIGMDPPFAYEVLEEDERYLVARHANGIVTKALKEGTVRGTRLCMDQYLAHPVTDRASFAAIKARYDPLSPARYPADWAAKVAAWRTRDYPLFLLHNGTFGLYSWLRSWVGTEEISYLFYDEPALVDEMLEFATEFLLALVERALRETDCDSFNFFEDFAGKGAALISPTLFRKFFLHRYQRIISRLKAAGIAHIWLDSDGDVFSLIPLLLEAGVDCLWPLEQASGMDPRRVRKAYPHLALAGGIDKMEIAKGRAAIDAEVYAKIPPLVEQGGYLPILDHAVPPDIALDDFTYYLEVKSRLLERG